MGQPLGYPMSPPPAPKKAPAWKVGGATILLEPELITADNLSSYKGWTAPR